MAARIGGSLIKQDFQRTYKLHLNQGDSQQTAVIRTLRTPGFQALAIYRFSSWLLASRKLTRVLLSPFQIVLHEMIRILWGIDIHKAAQIGPGCYIGHFGSIFIGAGTRIGANATLSQGVTIGVSGRGGDVGSPTIGNDVFVAPGAKLIGPIEIGDNVKIGANAVVHKDIPDNAVVVLDPGFQIISFAGNYSDDPDPSQLLKRV